MQFLYDGTRCFERSWSPSDVEPPQPFDRPFTLSLIAALGAGSNASDAKTPKSATTVVDYVKAWR